MITLNNINLSRLGFGAMPLSLAGRPDESEARKIIELYLSQGGNFFDTADIYGLDEHEKGHNEKLLCKSLQFNPSENTIIATKGGGSRPNGGWAFQDGHPKKLRAACEQSLKNLNTSTIKLYYLHGPDEKISFEDSVGELARLKEEGKILNVGLANVSLSQIKQAVKITPIAAIQNKCNPFCKEDFKNGLIKYCEMHNMMYVAYSPLGGWYDHAKLNASALFQRLQTRYETTSYVISLAWLFHKSHCIIAIPGIDKKDFVFQNFSALNLKLEKEDIHYIDQYPDTYSSVHQGVLLAS